MPTILTKQITGLEQIVVSLGTPLREGQAVVKIEHKTDDRTFDLHRRLYDGSIGLPDWGETLLVFPSPIVSIDPTNLELRTTTSYHVQAARRGIARDIVPILVAGLFLTKDNKLVFGVKNDESDGAVYVDGGKTTIVPVGSAGYNPMVVDQLFDTFYRESLQEAAIKHDSIEAPVLLGYQTGPRNTIAVNFVIFARTSDSSSDLMEKHSAAFALYQQAMKSVPELEARRAIAEAGLPNIGAYENKRLIFVDNQPGEIQSVVSSRRILYHGRVYRINDLARGVLIMFNAMNGHS